MPQTTILDVAVPDRPTDQPRFPKRLSENTLSLAGGPDAVAAGEHEISFQTVYVTDLVRFVREPSLVTSACEL